MAAVMSKVFSLFLATPLCMKLFLIPLDYMKFHKDIMTRDVTIDGDIFEPRGLLTGGSRK
jgi:chromosome segregation ATPase